MRNASSEVEKMKQMIEKSTGDQQEAD